MSTGSPNLREEHQAVANQMSNGEPEIPPDTPIEIPPEKAPPDIPPGGPLEEPEPLPELPPKTPTEVPPAPKEEYACVD